jgi:hypothetical protein
MKILYKFIAIFLLTVGVQEIAWGQIHPVQVSTFGLPPYPSYLSDYATGSSDKVQVQLLLTDVGSTREVYIKMNISGPGISGTTRSSYRPYYTLIGGSPVTLGMGDLSGYFDINNIDGLDAGHYAQALAEGAYFICFEVYDKIKDVPISNNGCVSILYTQNDPPILSMPGRKDGIVETSGAQQPLIFQWTPRHIGVGAYQYKFKLRKVTDSTMSPEQNLSQYGPDYAVNNVAGTTQIITAQDYTLVTVGGDKPDAQ